MEGLGRMCDDSTLQDRHWRTLERSTTRSFDQASAVTILIVWTTLVLSEAVAMVKLVALHSLQVRGRVAMLWPVPWIAHDSFYL